MKQKDIALIVVIGVVSAIVALLVSNMMFGTPSNRQQKAETVDLISDQFTAPDKAYFNEKSIDPTKIIHIGGDSTNQSPFNITQP